MSKPTDAIQLLKNQRIYTTYKLQYPVELADGTTLTEINLRRMKGYDQEALENQHFDFEKEAYKLTRFLIVRLSNLYPEDVNEIDSADILALGNLLTGLLTEGKSAVSES